MSIKYVLFWPGYLFLWLCYVSPTETGRSKNITKSSRQWAARGVLAPFYSIIFYAVILYVLHRKNYF